MDRSNRMPRHDVLLDQCLAAAEQHKLVLSIDISNNKSNSEYLLQYVKRLKGSFRLFNDLCHKAICSSFKIGSRDEGYDLKTFKTDLRHETEESIALVLGYLSELNVEYEISGLTLDTSSLSINFTLSSPSACPVDDKRHLIDIENVPSNDTVDTRHFPEQFIGGRPTSVDSNIHRSSEDSFATAENMRVRFESGIQNTSSPLLDRQEFVNSPVPLTGTKADIGCHLGSAFRTVGSTRISRSAHSNVKYNHCCPTPYLTEISRDYDSKNKDHNHRNADDLSAFPSRGFSDMRYDRSNHTPASYSEFPSSKISEAEFDRDRYAFDKYSRIPRRSAALHSHPCQPLSSRSSYPSNVPNASHPVLNGYMDAASVHLVKQQLFQKATDPFKGEPHKFNSWWQGMQNKMNGLPLSDHDKLLVLSAHTTGEPFKLIDRYVSVGGPDPSRTLNTVLNELRIQFGSSIRVANALITQVDTFPPIKSCYQTDELKNLLYLCQVIDANMSHSTELTIFNTARGSRDIWLKLPENIRNPWRSICDDHRVNNLGNYPPFASFVNFLAKKIREFDDPLLQYFYPNNESKNKTMKTALRTDYEDELFGSNQSPKDEVNHPYKNEVIKQKQAPKDTNNNNLCPLHDGGFHSLTDCKKFASLPYNEKYAILANNRLCFSCLGPHMKSNCRSSIKCNLCGGNHVTVMHLNPPKAVQPISM